jgi:hypothetical protein
MEKTELEEQLDPILLGLSGMTMQERFPTGRFGVYMRLFGGISMAG